MPNCSCSPILHVPTADDLPLDTSLGLCEGQLAVADDDPTVIYIAVADPGGGFVWVPLNGADDLTWLKFSGQIDASFADDVYLADWDVDPASTNPVNYPAPTQGDILRATFRVASNSTGNPVTFNVRHEGSVVLTGAIPATGVLTVIAPSPIPFLTGDTLSVQMVGAGAAGFVVATASVLARLRLG